MAEALETGMTADRNFTVDAGRTIDFMGDDCRVYATPELVRDIEHTCRDLIFENTADGKDSVGATVSIAHIAPTLLGMDVTITAKIVEVDGPKVVFEFTGQDPLEPICKGTHTRFVVDVEKTRGRLQAKAAKAESA